MAKYITRLVNTSSSYINGSNVNTDVLEAGNVWAESPKTTGILFNRFSFSSGNYTYTKFLRIQKIGNSTSNACLLYQATNAALAKSDTTMYTPTGNALSGYWNGTFHTAEKPIGVGSYSAWSLQTAKFTVLADGETVLYVQRLGHASEMAYSDGGYRGYGTSANPYALSLTRITTSDSSTSLALVDVRVNVISYYRNYGAQTLIGTQDVVCKYDGSDQTVSLSVAPPHRDGYSFDGWAITPDGEAVYTPVPGGDIEIEMTVHDVDLYAVWTPNTYTVAFDANGGTGNVMASQSFTYDSSQKLSKNTYAPQTGYSFAGWSRTPTGAVEYTDEQVVSNLTVGETITLYAVWEVIYYTVKYAGAGVNQSIDQTKTVVYGESFTLKTESSEGISPPVGFGTPLVWIGESYQEYQAGATVQNLTQIDGGEVTLTSRWTANTYSVRFNANGGTGAMETQPFAYGTPQNLTANSFTRENYVFRGWNTMPDGTGTAYADGQSVTNLTAVSGVVVDLYAVWKGTYTLRFSANAQGATGSMQDQQFVIGEASNLTINGFSLSGNTFASWNTSQVGTGSSYSDGQSVTDLSTVAGATIILYAQWIQIFTVRFFPNAPDGSSTTGTMADQTVQLSDASSTISANAFTCGGYAFDGWNTSADGDGDSYADEALVSTLASSVTGGYLDLYAQWTANTYTVSFNSNDGTSGTMGDQSFTYGEAKNLSKNGYAKNGYGFLGWAISAESSAVYTDEESVKNLTETDNGTVTLYAVWGKKFTVTFKKDDQSETSDVTQNCVLGRHDALKKNEFTNTGYVFAGWSKSSDGSQPIYADGSDADDVSPNGDACTLYAVWNAMRITVSFDPNGGSGSMSGQQVIGGASTSLSPNGFTAPANFHSDNDSWNTKPDGTGVTYSSGTEGGNKLIANYQDGSSVTLYAMWTRNVITVSFKRNDGTSETAPTQTFYAGEPQALDDHPEGWDEAGRSFIGWSEQDDATVQTYSEGQIVTFTSNNTQSQLDLYAVWKTWTVTVIYVNHGSAGESESAEYGDGITLPSSMTRTGYGFSNWFFNGQEYQAGAVVGQEVLWNGIDADGQSVYVTGIWNPIHYTINFSENGGTGEMDEVGCYYDVPLVLPKCMFTKEGFTFDGWNTEPDGKGLFYADMAKVQNLSSVDNEEVTLYAIWVKSTQLHQYEEYEIPIADGAEEPDVGSEETPVGFPTGINVTIAEDSNQAFTRTYGGITYGLHLRSFRGMMYADVSVNGIVVCLGVRCVPNKWLIPNTATMPDDAGNMRFEVDGNDYPYFTDFGSSARLVFYTREEISAGA